MEIIDDYLRESDITAYRVRYDSYQRRYCNLDKTPKDFLKDGEVCFIMKESDLLKLLQQHNQNNINEPDLEFAELIS